MSEPRYSLEAVNELVSKALEQMKNDNNTDPVTYLNQLINNPDFERQISSTAASPTLTGENCSFEVRCKPLTIVVLGASGDLAKKKTFPALFTLFRNNMLPANVNIVGYARSKLTVEQLVEHYNKYLPKGFDEEKAAFSRRLSYVAGGYDDVPSFENLHRELCTLETAAMKGREANRIFYLALPPSVFVGACRGIKAAAMPQNGGWVRVVVEKPFGKDTDSSKELAGSLGELFSESQLYRIDHYLGKEMVQNLVTLRFANHVFGAVWSNRHISNVQITFKETIGTEGRGGYFDSFGIIRDVIQNHLTQILALVAMEKPKSLDGEAIRDEKVAVLRCVQPVKLENCVLGQYTAKPDGSVEGYLDDPTVPKGSVCPTFASMVLNIHNDRWDGVPFIIKAGKALDSKAVVIRIQFRDEILPFGDRTQRNELVIRAQPNEAMYLKIAAKSPGIGSDVMMTELDLTYKQRYDSVRLPDAYESLINEVVQGNSTNFVRDDELDAAWRIYTPLLHAIDAGHAKPTPYPMGSRGPPAADELVERVGFKRSTDYQWGGAAQPAAHM